MTILLGIGIETESPTTIHMARNGHIALANLNDIKYVGIVSRRQGSDWFNAKGAFCKGSPHFNGSIVGAAYETRSI